MTQNNPDFAPGVPSESEEAIVEEIEVEFAPGTNPGAVPPQEPAAPYNGAPDPAGAYPPPAQPFAAPGAAYPQPPAQPYGPPAQQPYPQQGYQQAPGYQQGPTYQQGYAQGPGIPYVETQFGTYQPVLRWSSKSKLAAGLFGIFLGTFGVHNFYLGFTGKAVAQLLITILSFGLLSWVSAIWGLIEGVLILASATGTSWDLDAEGFPMAPMGSQTA